MTTMPTAFKPLKKYFVDTPHPLHDLRYIQVLLLRETLDEIILRTEDNRDINGTLFPDDTQRVAFLPQKQKAVESRDFAAMLRALNAYDSKTICYLKDSLCMACPRCTLFGGAIPAARNSKPSDKIKASIIGRVKYATAYSLQRYEAVRQTRTFNAISTATSSTGSALGQRISVKAGTHFASIVTLRAVTWEEFLVAVRVILGASRYGAETRLGGMVRNHLLGIVGGPTEFIAPLELAVRLGSVEGEPTLDAQRTHASDIVSEFVEASIEGKQAKILETSEIKSLFTAIR
ncbi:MAG: type I-D CRISPR-associated protein Cas7/Csc2, partial [Chloroflexi bacterium]|nr:type I-D CRISPR-associated protein Cas7/Csc2 [Chloroflexota bacterium]